MITSSIRVACLNCQFWGTHKFLRVHYVWEDTSQSEACGSQSCVHAPLQQVLVTVSPTKTNAHAHPSLRSPPSGHGEFNITSLTSGQCCLSSSTSLARCPLCSNIASDRVPAAGICEAYSTTYCPPIFLRCAVVLVSAVLYPRTIRQAYSCATGRAISLTAYTVNSLHQTLHWVSHSVVTHQSLQIICVQYHARVTSMGRVKSDLWWHHATFLEPMGLQGRARSHHASWVSCLPPHLDCSWTQFWGCSQTEWWGWRGHAEWGQDLIHGQITISISHVNNTQLNTTYGHIPMMRQTSMQ